MTTDRAVAVIAATKAAMDWESACDAYRVAAPWDDPVVRDPRSMVEEALARGGRPAFRDGLSNFTVVRDMVEDWHQPNLVPPAEPTDPRQRALAARKARNTGPSAPGLDGRPR